MKDQNYFKNIMDTFDPLRENTKESYIKDIENIASQLIKTYKGKTLDEFTLTVFEKMNPKLQSFMDSANNKTVENVTDKISKIYKNEK